MNGDSLYLLARKPHNTKRISLIRRVRQDVNQKLMLILPDDTRINNYSYDCPYVNKLIPCSRANVQGETHRARQACALPLLYVGSFHSIKQKKRLIDPFCYLPTISYISPPIRLPHVSTGEEAYPEQLHIMQKVGLHIVTVPGRYLVIGTIILVVVSRR